MTDGESGADAPRIIEWDGGLTWLADPTEAMQRASHALVADGDVWLVDPVDAPGVEDDVADLGDVAGVVVLLDRHRRDAGAVAARYDVAVHVPATLGDAVDGLGTSVEQFAGELADTGYLARRVVASRFWREAALVGPGVLSSGGVGAAPAAAAGTVVVPEALGTSPFFRAGAERVGIHPVLRPWPPRRRLGDLAPERLLVGHGEPVLEDAAPAMADALAGARRRAPRAYLDILRSVAGG